MAILIVVVIVVAGGAIGITSVVLNHAAASQSRNTQAPAVYELQAWASGADSLAVAWSCDIHQGTADATPQAGTTRLIGLPATVFSATSQGMSCVVTKQEVGTIVVQLIRNGAEVDSVNSGVQDNQSVHVGS